MDQDGGRADRLYVGHPPQPLLRDALRVRTERIPLFECHRILTTVRALKRETVEPLDVLAIRLCACANVAMMTLRAAAPRLV